MKNKRKGILSLLLCAALLLTAMINPASTYAADSSAANYYEDISAYRGDTYTAPEADGETVFAGWYEDAAFTNAIEKDVKSGPAYAKFVDADVLSVKCQITSGTTLTSASTSLRMLTSVDSLNYSSVGFVIGINGKTATRTSNIVYKTVTATEGGVVKSFKPDIFCEASNYIMSYKITDILNRIFSTSIEITPTWTTLDGTIVTGRAKNVVISDELADFTKGVTFEKPLHAEAITNAELVKYDETSIGAQENSYGKYGIAGNVTGSTWPHFYITYDRTYAAGSYLTFKMYVEVDPDVAQDKWCWADSWYATQKTAKITEFNKWIDVSFQLTDNSTDKLDFFLNFDGGSGSTMFGDTPMKVYFDNFYIAEGNFEKGITFENPAEKYLFSKNNVDYTFEKFDGTTALKYDSTGVRWPYIKAGFNKTYTGAATRLCFRIYVKADEALVKDQVFYVGDDDGTRHPFNQWTEGWVSVANGSTDKQIYLNFDAAINAIGASTPITVYLDDFYLTTGNVEEGLTFENPAEKYVFWKGNADYSFEEFDGTTAMKMVVGQNWPNIYMALPQAYTEAKTLYFKVYAKADESTAADQVFYVGDNDPTKHKFNCWEEAFVTIPANQGYVNPFLNFEAALKTIGSGNITLYLDDFQIR